MVKKSTAPLLLAIIACFALAATGPVWAKKPPKPPPEPDPPPVQYELQLIGHSTSFLPHDINVGGDIVGTHWVDGADGKRACVYIEALGMTFDLSDIAQLPDGWTAKWACGINEHGQVVGSAKDESEISTAFLFDPNATPNFVLLPHVGTYRDQAFRINDHGDIVGIWRVAEGEAYVFLCPAGGVPEDIGLPPVTLTPGIEVDINNSGQITTTAGYRLTPATPGTYADGFIEEFFPDLFIKGINDSGTFVGGTKFFGTTPPTKKKFYDGAFRYIDPGPDAEILYQWTPGEPDPELWWQATATDINSSGHVVLHGVVDGGRVQSFLYTTEHGLLNLSDLVVGDELDLAIWDAAQTIDYPVIGDGDPNDTGFGQIAVGVVGVGTFLLTPLPPPE